MALHPHAEAYRQALAKGDHTTAASILVKAHKGDYNSDMVNDFHRVGRMTRAELAAPADDGAGAIPSVTVESRTTVWSRMRGGR